MLCRLWFVVLCACSGDEPQVGGETHWLRACEADADCGGTLQCVCGSCTRACAGDGSCTGGPAAACYDLQSPLLVQRCTGLGAQAVAAACLPSCDRSAQCGEQRACAQGACVPPPPADPGLTRGQDAGVLGTAGTAGPAAPAPDADAADPAAQISWDDPVRVPEWSKQIAGPDASRLVGTWTTRACDHRSAPTYHPNARTECRQLVISAGADGSVHGFLQFIREPVPPPWPPVDPERGYPPDASMLMVRWFHDVGASHFPYPLRDARFANGVLEFVWSPADLFEAWCQAQLPQRWTIDDHALYFCAPQDSARQAALDPVRAALCMGVQEGAVCMNEDGNEEPCACLEDTRATCGTSACRCTPEGCTSNPQTHAFRVTLELDGDSLVGDTKELDRFTPLLLDREAP